MRETCSRCGREFMLGDFVVPVHEWEVAATEGPSRLPSEFIHERCFGRPNKHMQVYG